MFQAPLLSQIADEMIAQYLSVSVKVGSGFLILKLSKVIALYVITATAVAYWTHTYCWSVSNLLPVRL